MAILVALFSVFLNQATTPPPQKPPDLSTLMMEGTFKVFGPSTANPKERVVGTAFLMGRPVPGQAGRYYYVLVTAAHVLADIQGNDATLVMRVKAGLDSYRRIEHRLQIRDGWRPLWTQHPTADVAAMYASLPDNVASQPIPEEYLATDSDFENYGFHPGDEVFTIGYPYGRESNDFGFAILRSGRIASHPLIPSASLKTFLVDLSVFGGNSGGAIFVNQGSRSSGGNLTFGLVFRILGLVSSQMVMTDGERLSVARIVHASFIKETMSILPPPPKQ